MTRSFFARPSTFSRSSRRVHGGPNQSSAAGGDGIHVTYVGDELSVETRKLVDILVPIIIGQILLRTDRGIDADGQPFKPYSTSHAKQRTKRGLGAVPVDLRMTGQMLGSLGLRRVAVMVDGVQMTIAPSAQQMLKARSIELDGRHFVGLSPADTRAIAEQLERRGIPVSVTESRPGA